METKNFFKDIYDDFFGIEKLTRENEKLKKELNLNEDDIPEIEVKKNEEIQNKEKKGLEDTFEYEEEAKEKISEKQSKDEKMANFFSKVDNLLITEESKNVLKKMIEYTRKYNENIEKQYIPFNMCIYSDNKETIYEIVDIISDATIYFSYVNRANTIEVSFYNLEKTEQINDIYSNVNSVIYLKDWEGLIAQDQSFRTKFLYKMLEKVENGDEKFITITSSKSKDILKQAFDKNEDIKNKIFKFEIIGIKPEIQEVYQKVLEKLKIDNEVSDEVSIKLLDYISATYPNATVSFPEYRDNLCNYILFNKKEDIKPENIPEYEKEKTVDEIFEELNELVGLEKVKQTLQDLVSLIELKNKTKDELKLQSTNLHMVFLGNPGTGKTTVARMIAQILYHLKYIKQNKLIEVSSKDLVAEYVGQTSPKTMAVIEKAKGGVLFIDEAYSLASTGSQGNSYNEEAIATLIQAMENYRDDLVVIFAGYTKEMQAFLNTNSGIVSRIGYTLEFEDYTEEQLLQIFKNMLSKAGFEIKEDALEKTIEIIREYKNAKNFGNARFIRNLYEKTIIKHASNTRNKKNKKILKTITKDDICTDNLLKM